MGLDSPFETQPAELNTDLTAFSSLPVIPTEATANFEWIMDLAC